MNNITFLYQVSFSLDMQNILDKEKSEQTRKVMYKIHKNYMVARYGRYKKNVFCI